MFLSPIGSSKTMKKIIAVLLFNFLLGISVFAQEAEKIDEFENIPCDDYLARMDNAMVTAQNYPSSTVYVLVYEGKELRYNDRKNKTETVLPARGTAEKKILSMKKYLSLKKFPGERFAFIEAGFRENLTVEIWRVPEGASPPKSSSTLKEMKYRKGKAFGFCLECCGI